MKVAGNLASQRNFAVKMLMLTAIVLGLDPSLLAANGPSLEFDEYTKDLGELPEELSPEVVFRFQNKGNSELIIYELKGSCNCQDFRVTKSRIAPGQSGQLITKVIPKRNSGPATDIIKIKSNDKIRPIQVVRIKRFVIKQTVLEPERLIIRNLDYRRPTVRKVSILGPTGSHSFKIIKVESDDTRITPELIYRGRTDDNRSKWDMKVTIIAQKPYNFEETRKITIFTSEKKKPMMTLPIIMKENIPIQITPKSLSFIIRGSTQFKKSQIRVSYFGNTEFDVRSDANSIGFLPDVNLPSYARISLVSTKTNRLRSHWTYELEIDPKAKLIAPIQVDKIEFRFSHLDISVFVPISVIKLQGQGTKGPEASSFRKLNLDPHIVGKFKGIRNE